MQTVLTDPLGTDTLSNAITDVQGLVTGTYMPLYVGAVIFGVALSIGIRWLRKGARAASGR